MRPCKGGCGLWQSRRLPRRHRCRFEACWGLSEPFSDSLEDPVTVKNLPLHANSHQVTQEGTTEVTVFFTKPIPGIDPNLLSGIYNTFGCHWCGRRPPMRVEDDGVYIDEACTVPEGITTVIHLEVPSGTIIVRDDLRAVYDVDRDDLADYNSVLGQAQYVEAMAQLGCAYGPVGNSCPDLWKTGKDTYVIGKMPYDEETDEQIVTPPGSVKLAGVCTGLWAYSIADYQDWLSKGGETVEELGWTSTLVEVPPGTYQFTLHSGEKGFDHWGENGVIFADVKKVA
jgi:hypothetical protein